MALLVTIVLAIMMTSLSGDGESAHEGDGELGEHCVYVRWVARFRRNATAT